MQSIMDRNKGTIIRTKDRDTLLKELGDLIKTKLALTEMGDSLVEIDAKIVAKKAQVNAL